MSQLKWSTTIQWLKKQAFSTSHALGMSPLRILLSAILVVGVGFLVLHLAFPGDSPASTDVVLSPKEILKGQAELDQRLHALFNRKLSNANSFLISIDEIQDTETETSELEASHSLTPSQEEMVARIRLQNKGSTLVVLMQGGLSHDAERADLIRFCETNREANGLELRNMSRYWMCALPAVDFVEDPSEETLKTFIDTIDQHENYYLDSPVQSKLLAEIFIRPINNPSKHSEIVIQGAQEFAQRMRGSDSSGVCFIGERLIQLAIFGQYDLETLGSRIAWNDPSAAADLEGAITALSSNMGTTPVNVWDVIIRSYESYLSRGDVEKAGNAWQRMWTLSQQIQSEDAKTQVQTKLRLQKQRTESIGTTFDLSGSRLKDGKPIDLGSYEYVAVIFIDEGRDSIKQFRKLVAASQSKQQNFYSILVLSEGQFQQGVDLVKATNLEFAIVNVATAKKFQEELSVDVTPYIVLVDKSGKILNAHLHFDQLETRIAQLKSSNL